MTRPRCIKGASTSPSLSSPQLQDYPCSAFMSSMERNGNLPLFKPIQGKLQLILGIKNVKDSVPANFANTLEELAELLVRASSSLLS